MDQLIQKPLGDLPSSYRNLGVTTGYAPLPPEQLRMFILGPRFQGKTTFVAGIPRNLIIDAEKGAWGVPDDVTRAGRYTIENYESLDRMITQLETDAKTGRKYFDRVTFDTIDEIVEIVAKQHLPTTVNQDVDDIRQWGQSGAGYQKLTDFLTGMVRRLGRAGYAWTVVGHIKEVRITLPGKKTEIWVPRPVLYDSCSAVFNRISDMTATCQVVPIERPKEVKIEGMGDMVAGVETVNRVVLDCSVQEIGFGSGSGKLRGVANLNFKTELPELAPGVYGWDVFAKQFGEETAKVRDGKF